MLEAPVCPQVLFGVLAHLCLKQGVKPGGIRRFTFTREVLKWRLNRQGVTPGIRQPLDLEGQYRRAGNLCQLGGNCQRICLHTKKRSKDTVFACQASGLVRTRQSSRTLVLL